MTDPNATPPTQPTYPTYPQYPAYPHAPAPVLKRPPLTKRQRRAAIGTGILSFVILQLGFLAMLVGAVLLIFALVAFITQKATEPFAFSPEDEEALAELGIWGDVSRDFVNSMTADTGWINGVVPIVVGLVLAVVSIIVSGLILRARGVSRPWGVTWSAAAIASVALTIITWVFHIIYRIVTMWILLDTFEGAVIEFVVEAALMIAIAVAVGALTWWWMAHALRARPELPRAGVPHPGVSQPAAPSTAPYPGR